MDHPYVIELRRVWADAADSAHDLAHVQRVWHSCRAIAEQTGGDLEILHPAALFHDIVNLPKSDPNRSAASRHSADHAAAFLSKTGFPAAKIDGVHHAIHAHSYSASTPCQTLEARILQDADRLDALGAIGIARCFAVSGQLGRALFHPDDPMAENRPLDDSAYALDHFQTKLFRIADGLHTEPARQMAADRCATMRTFCAALVAETGRA